MLALLHLASLFELCLYSTQHGSDDKTDSDHFSPSSSHHTARVTKLKTGTQSES